MNGHGRAWTFLAAAGLLTEAHALRYANPHGPDVLASIDEQREQRFMGRHSEAFDA